MEGLIEVVCEDLTCFRVRADTLEPVGSSYYEPAAVRDPRGPQMSHGEWSRRRSEMRRSEYDAKRHAAAYPGF
jgi:hypothetical protein